VFIIALGYNQVIELFPTGGGGYRVATALLGPRMLCQQTDLQARQLPDRVAA